MFRRARFNPWLELRFYFFIHVLYMFDFVASETEGMIRLFGGSDSSSGIVEIFYNNKWGMHGV